MIPLIDDESYDETKDDAEYNNDKNFREILKDETDIWYKIQDKDNVEKIFNDLMNKQKDIRTILPTMNNIESSRGHTCVLLKIENSEKEQYFPLFDMAGSENIQAMYDFFSSFPKKNKVEKVMKTINNITKTYDIENNNIKYTSLKQLFKNDPIKKYVGGGKPIKEPKKIINEKPDIRSDNDNDSDSLLFINKVVKEGFYINHTIAIFLFIMACVGKTVQSVFNNNTDNFNNIINDVNIQLKNKVDISNSEFKINTRMLIDDDKITFNSILNKSCIWAQVLMSFLYWNEDTDVSRNNRMKKIESTYDGSKYIDNIKDDKYCILEYKEFMGNNIKVLNYMLL
jgi:hypothetical protein